jgi:ribosomal protein S18 acetylase RimI-like enzyme
MTSGEGRHGIRIRAASADDLVEMARIHRAAYSSEHFLALLPEATLVEYYRTFLADGSQGLIAEHDGTGSSPMTMAGFAVFGGGLGPRIDRFKRVHRAAIVRTALAHPLIVLRKMAMGALGAGRAPNPHSPAGWLLLSIAVRGGRRGIGSALMTGMLQEASAAGQRALGLYVRHSNVPALNAYLRMGFSIIESVSDQYYMETTVKPSTDTGNP